MISVAKDAVLGGGESTARNAPDDKSEGDDGSTETKGARSPLVPRPSDEASAKLSVGAGQGPP